MSLVGTCRVVDISKLYVSPFNARQQENESKTSEGFVWLCNSIKTEGLIEPIVVRPVGDKYEIVAGTRRYAALKQIGEKQASIVVREMSDNDVRIASLIENIHRLDLDEDEKEETLSDIYLSTWDEWVNPKDLRERPFDNDKDKLKLAKSYLNRLHNEETGGVSSVNFSQVYGHKNQENTQTVFPTKAFKYLSARVGYALSYQINILRGFGAFSLNKDFYEELPPTYKEIADRIAKETKLEEDEKQQMSKRMSTARKVHKERVKHPKTQRQKAETAAKTYANKVKRQRLAEQRRIEQEKEKAVKEREKLAKSKTFQEQETEQNAVRARQEILGLSHKLFTLLTGQEIQGIDPAMYESFARNTQATQTMNQLVTYFISSGEIASHQRIVIGLNAALQKYRDMLYNAIESQKRKEDMSGK